MNRGERIVAAVLGTLVFLGLFYFIYTSMRAAPALPPLEENFSEAGEDFDFEVFEGSDTLDNFSEDLSTAPVRGRK